MPSDPTPMLVLGPLLRHVDPVSATVWVETDRPCTVEVLGRTARTFRVSDHHYALVLVEGLEPGSTTEYEVHLDGERVWPGRCDLPAQPHPDAGRPGPFRLAFGSCRYATPGTVSTDDGIPPDALDVYAATTAATPEDEWPDALVLLGDQVYADELTPGTEKWIAQRRLAGEAAGQAGRRLRGVHPALRRVVDRSAGALAAVDDPVVDDLRRPRDDRRLEHLGRLAGEGDAGRGGPSASSAGWPATGSTSTWATSAPTSWPRTRRGWPCRSSTAPTAHRSCGSWPSGPTGSRRACAGATCGTGARRGW